MASTWLAAGWPSRLAALFPFPSIKEAKQKLGLKGTRGKGFSTCREGAAMGLRKGLVCTEQPCRDVQYQGL